MCICLGSPRVFRSKYWQSNQYYLGQVDYYRWFWNTSKQTPGRIRPRFFALFYYFKNGGAECCETPLRYVQPWSSPTQHTWNPTQSQPIITNIVPAHCPSTQVGSRAHPPTHCHTMSLFISQKSLWWAFEIISFLIWLYPQNEFANAWVLCAWQDFK